METSSESCLENIFYLVVDREEVWPGQPRPLEGDGHRLAVQEEGAGGRDCVPLSQQQADLGGQPRGAGGDLHLAQADRHHDVVAAGPPRLQQSVSDQTGGSQDGLGSCWEPRGWLRVS